jgi:hypothetical protein
LGKNAGHLWGYVQVIKPPTLLEICGPLMMSYPAQNHLQYRFTVQGSGTRLTFVHRSMGLISPEHRDGMPKGWGHWLERIRLHAERMTTQAKNSKNTGTTPPHGQENPGLSYFFKDPSGGVLLVYRVVSCVGRAVSRQLGKPVRDSDRPLS